MPDLKDQLVRLGATRKELRPHIRPMLAALKKAKNQYTEIPRVQAGIWCSFWWYFLEILAAKGVLEYEGDLDRAIDNFGDDLNDLTTRDLKKDLSAQLEWDDSTGDFFIVWDAASDFTQTWSRYAPKLVSKYKGTGRDQILSIDFKAAGRLLPSAAKKGLQKDPDLIMAESISTKPFLAALKNQGLPAPMRLEKALLDNQTVEADAGKVFYLRCETGSLA